MISSRSCSSLKRSSKKQLRNRTAEICILAAAICITLCAGWTGCTRKLPAQDGPVQPIVIAVEIDPSCRRKWDELLDTNPPPDSVRLLPSGSTAAGTDEETPTVSGRIRVFRSSDAVSFETVAEEASSCARIGLAADVTDRPGASVSASISASADPDASPDPVPDPKIRILDSSPLIPMLPLHDPRSDVDPETARDLPLLSPEEIGSALKGVSVGGLYPSSPGYPLLRFTLLEFSWLGDDRSTGPSVFAARSDIGQWLSALREAVPSEDAGRARIRWIAGVGDLMVQRGIQDILIAREERGLELIFNDTLPLLQKQDFLMGNLEGAVTTGGTPVPKSYNFRFSPRVLPWLQAAGFNYLSLTNNHCYDYGEKGFTDTLDNLAAYNLATSGAGRTPDEAYAPYETKVADFHLKVLSVGAYPREKNGFDGRSQAGVSEDRAGIIFSGPEALQSIRDFSGRESIDVIMVHGGEEWSRTPSEEQKSFYRACIDAGADLVIGHHPHVLQGMEYYRGGLIAYSLGNFLFPGMYVMPYAEETVILSVGFIGDRPVYVRPWPVRIDNREIRLEKEVGKILPRFLELTEKLQ